MTTHNVPTNAQPTDANREPDQDRHARAQACSVCQQVAGSYGGARRDKTEARQIRKGGYVPSLRAQRELLDTPWMTETGCHLSIPPSYAQHIGEQLKAAIEVAA